MLKVCSKCKDVKDHYDSGPYVCKDCRVAYDKTPARKEYMKAYNKKYREDHWNDPVYRARINELQREYKRRPEVQERYRQVARAAHRRRYLARRAEILTSSKQRYVENPEPQRVRSRARYWRDPDGVKAKTLQWFRTNPGKRSLYNRTFKEKHPVENRFQRRASWHNRRARLLGAGRHTAQEFMDKCVAANWACAYCGVTVTPATVTKDHVVPVSKGGSNTIDNVVPACKQCNLRKGSTAPEKVT